MKFFRYEIGKPSEHNIFIVWDEEQDLGFLPNKNAAYEQIRLKLGVSRLNRKLIRLTELTLGQYYVEQENEKHKLREEIDHLQATNKEQKEHIEKLTSKVDSLDVLNRFAASHETVHFAETLKQSTYGSVEWAAGETILRVIQAGNIADEY